MSSNVTRLNNPGGLDAPRRSDFELAAMLIENQHQPPKWREAFQRVKFDTADNPEWDGERWVVIVAKGEAADRIAEAYDG